MKERQIEEKRWRNKFALTEGLKKGTSVMKTDFYGLSCQLMAFGDIATREFSNILKHYKNLVKCFVSEVRGSNFQSEMSS